MRYKKLGRSGLLVSEVCLGTMTFGGGEGLWRIVGSLNQEASTKLVKDSFDAGVNFFDTADVYHSGDSEKLLGGAIRSLKLPRDEIVVATKAFGRIALAPLPENATEDQTRDWNRRSTARNISGVSRKHLFDAVDDSLKRLGLDYIDLYQVHGFDPLTPLDETLRALDDIVRSGRVRYIGLCNYAAWQIAKALGVSAKEKLARFESVQMYYSIAGRDLEREVVPLAVDEQLAILPWSPLAGGLMSGKFKREGSGPEGSRRVSFDFPPVDKERAFNVLDAIAPMAKSHGCSEARIALAWLLHQQPVTSVIIGARTPEQLSDNLQAVSVKLTTEELAKLDEVSALPREYPGWMLHRQSSDRLSQI